MAAFIPSSYLNETSLNGSVLSPPPRHTSDLNSPNPFTLPVAIQVAIALSGAILLTCMRLFTQHFVSKGLVVEDYIMLVGMIIQVVNIILDVIIVQNGIGKHMWNLSWLQFFEASKFVWVFVTLFHSSVALIKIAILLQIKRIFGTNKTIRAICWVCIAIDTMFYVPVVLLNIFQCTPISGAWNRAQPSKCISIAVLYKASGIFNVVSDLVMLAIPLVIIMRLNMAIKRKWLVLAVFATGIVAWIASVLRAVWTFRTFHSKDLSFNLVWMGIFCTYEAVLGILAFFMPMAAILAKYVQTKLHDRSRGKQPGPIGRQYARHIERVLSKRPGHPYEMPSLASFEERTQGIERQITTTIEFMPAIQEMDNSSSTKSDLTTSFERRLW